MCCDTECWLRDVALLNVLKVINLRELGANECENCGAGTSYEINIRADCSGEVMCSDRFWPAAFMYCYLTATVRKRIANKLPKQFCNMS